MRWLWASAAATAMAFAGIAAASAQPVSGPTFDCGRATTGLSQAICRDPATWEADWALSTTYWAAYFSVDGPDRTRLRDAHVTWIKSVERECGLDGSMAPDTSRAGPCVAQRYRTRAAAYRGSLSGDAATEATLRPNALIAVQSRLIDLGFMSGQADGVFGAGTRQAFRAYRQTLGHLPSDFLDPQERSALLRRPSNEEARGPMRAAGRGSSTYPPRGMPSSEMPGRLPGVAEQVLAGVLGGRVYPAPPPFARREPMIPSARDADDEEFEGPSRFAPPHTSPGQPVATAPARSPDSEFSDAGTAVVASPLGVPAKAAETGIRTVEVKGTGDSADAARKDAARLAIQQVVGVFVDNRRRIELNVSDAKVSEVVNEKLVSYTNAYVSKMDVVGTEQRNGTYEVTARVGVSVAPLLKVLQENAVPTVAFDTASAASTVETLSQEKTGAIELYADLVEKADALVKVGVGTPQVDASLPSSPDEAWIRIPLTYGLNDDAVREWRTKFGLFAQQRAEAVFKVGQQRTQEGCEFPVLELGFGAMSDRHQVGFIAERPGAQQEGVAACFASYETPGGLVAECLGRTFFSEGRGDRCTPDKPCLHFRQKAAQVRLVVELLDGNKDVIYASRTPFQGYPGIALANSRRAPQGQERGFFNYCVPAQTLFFASRHRDSGVAFGDVLVFPPKGSRVRGYMNLRLPNAVISRIGSVRARIAKDAT